jgi:hypothetical protein
LLKNILAIIVSAVLLSTTIVAQSFNGEASRDSQLADKARVKVQKLGVGQKARVEVKLLDDTKLKGFVSAAGQDTFTVVDSKTGGSTNISYGEVAQVKKPGGISPLTWGIIGGAAVATVVVAVTVLYPVLCDGGAGC